MGAPWGTSTTDTLRKVRPVVRQRTVPNKAAAGYETGELAATATTASGAWESCHDPEPGMACEKGDSDAGP